MQRVALPSAYIISADSMGAVKAGIGSRVVLSEEEHDPLLADARGTWERPDVSLAGQGVGVILVKEPMKGSL